MGVPQAVLGFVIFIVMVACGGGVSDVAPGPSPTPPSPVATATPPPSTATPIAGHLLTREITVSNGSANRKVTAEIARTPVEWETGLMRRTSMGEDEGMLFLFPTDSTQGFWMKDTVLPLTIAYIDAAGHIVDMRDGKPFDAETILTPSHAYRNVLEMNQGWFSRHGFGIGSTVSSPTDVGTR